MVRTLGYKYPELVHGFLCRELSAESAETQWIYVSHHANAMYCGCSETEISQRSLIPIMIHRNGILAANNDCMQFLYNC